MKRNPNSFLYRMLFFFVACLLSACDLTSQTPNVNPPPATLAGMILLSTQTQTSSFGQASATFTTAALASTITTVPPSATPPPPTRTPTAIPALSSNTPTEMEVNIFLIAVEDNGHSGPLVGCGDSAVAVIVHVPYTTGVLRAALTALLGIHDQHYGESGLYNALYQSHLTVGDVTINSGTATIHLNGSLTMGGECDSPRIEAQLKQTALQFSTVHAVSIFINGQPLTQVLSGR